MKTIVLEQPGQLRAVETAQPGDLPAGHALVRVGVVGICGTDWHAYRGKQPFFSYPRVLGHELGVTVESVNDSSSDLRAGDQCVVEPYLNCGTCIACRRGKSNCCANLKVLGVHLDGGMRERIVVPAAKLHRSKKLSLEQLALVEPLGIGCHAAERAGISAGEWVAIIGAGPIGLSVMPFAKAAGGKIIAMDVSAARLAFCRASMGIEHTINVGTHEVGAELKRLTNGDLPTCVIDATGNPLSMARCFDLVAPGGRIVFVGLFQGDLTFNDPNFHRRELTVIASRNSRPADFEKIIAMAERGEIDTKPWVTHRVGLGEVPNAFEKLLSPESGVLKAMIEV
jgi:2-desacetyl-2-hydroxyethyl bacteriochlorophyllide A dehydrogenase